MKVKFLGIAGKGKGTELLRQMRGRPLGPMQRESNALTEGSRMVDLSLLGLLAKIKCRNVGVGGRGPLAKSDCLGCHN